MNINEKLRKNSGNINIAGRLVGFLYDLMRDHIVPGKIEELVRDAEKFENKDISCFSNGWLAKYAENIANRLKNKYELYLFSEEKNNCQFIEEFNSLIAMQCFILDNYKKYSQKDYFIFIDLNLDYFSIESNYEGKLIFTKFDEAKNTK